MKILVFELKTDAGDQNRTGVSSLGKLVLVYLVSLVLIISSKQVILKDFFRIYSTTKLKVDTGYNYRPLGSRMSTTLD